MNERESDKYAPPPLAALLNEGGGLAKPDMDPNQLRKFSVEIEKPEEAPPLVVYQSEARRIGAHYDLPY
jgi:hypothetical protein